MRFGKVGRADRERYDRTSTSQAATGLESMKGERFFLFWFWEGHPFFSGVSVFFSAIFLEGNRFNSYSTVVELLSSSGFGRLAV